MARLLEWPIQRCWRRTLVHSTCHLARELDVIASRIIRRIATPRILAFGACSILLHAFAAGVRIRDSDDSLYQLSISPVRNVRRRS